MYFKTTITYVIKMPAFSRREHKHAAQDKYFFMKREKILYVYYQYCKVNI